MTGSVAEQHYGTQNAQGRCAAIAANAEKSRSRQVGTLSL